jgi:hypothetical protein
MKKKATGPNTIGEYAHRPMRSSRGEEEDEGIGIREEGIESTGAELESCVTPAQR